MLVGDLVTRNNRLVVSTFETRILASCIVNTKRNDQRGRESRGAHLLCGPHQHPVGAIVPWRRQKLNGDSDEHD